MTISSPKKAAVLSRDAEATKNRILDAAEEEFAKTGLLGTRTEAIAAKTGVTKSMIFYHFGDKEGLYQAVLERAIATRVRAMQTVDTNATEPEEALCALVTTILDESGHNSNLPAIFFYEGIQNKGKFYGQIAIASTYEPIVNVLRRGMAAGKFRELDPLHVAVNIVGLCVFYFCHHENVKHLWPSGTDLRSPGMREQHKKEAIKQIVASVLA